MIDVCIVLSSFNGARYISEQIESIRRQTFRDWVLLVRDDGSSDETPAILDRYRARDSRIVILSDGRGNLGSARSFAVALEHAARLDPRYIALSDQDDIWHPDKLARQLSLLRSREGAVGDEVPLLAHSDLTVVAEDLTVIHPSFVRFHRLSPVQDVPLRKLLVQNFVTGCTAMVNCALLRVALPFPKVLVHDWWLALCAGAVGELLFDPAPTLLYRQHGANLLGARGWVHGYRDSVLHPVTWWRRGAEGFSAALEQAGELDRRCECHVRRTPAAVASLRLLRDYCSAFGSGASVFRRLSTVHRHGIRPSSPFSSPLGFYARLLFSPSTGSGAEPLAAGGRAQETGIESRSSA